MENDRKEYLAAFVIGAIVGVGATLLLAPEDKPVKRRHILELEPTVRRIKRRVRPTKMQRRTRRLREALRYR